MNEAIKKQWVEALRSGKYTQGQRRLRIDNSYCCLGVLCDLVQPKGWAELGSGSFTHDGAFGMPSPGFREELGVGAWPYVEIDGERAKLDEHNDNGKTFAQIADAIESQL